MGGGGTVYWYSATFAVAFCAGSIFCPDPSRPDGGTFVSRGATLKKVWADDVLIYDADAPKNIIAPVWHSGSELQSPDATIVAKMGVPSTAAPTFPGLAYAVFTDMSLEDFSNRIPNFSAEIETSPVKLADVFTDLCRSAGLLSSQIDASAGASVPVTGFTAASRGEVQTDIQGLLLAYGFDAVEVDGVLRLVARGGSPLLTVAADDLGASTGSGAPKLVRKRGQITELPGRVDVAFADAENSYLTGNLGVVRQSADVQNVQQLSLSLALTPDEARAIAGRELDRYWAETETYQLSLPPKYLKVAPGDVLLVPMDETVQRVRVLKVGMAPIGELKLEGVYDDPAVNSQPTAGGGSGNNQQTLTPVPSAWVAWSGPEVRDADQMSPGFYVAASGGDGWQGCTVFYSTDGGANWIEGPAITGRCVFGYADSELGGPATPNAFDDVNTVSVVTDVSGGTLSNAPDSAILAGNNHAAIGNEILGFGVATLTGPHVYTLSHLRRGERGTATDGHTEGELFALLTPDIARVNVAEELVGQTVLVKCVSRYQTLSDVTTQTAVVIRPRTLTSQEQILASVVFPRFIAPVTVQPTTTSAVDWTTFDASAYVPETALAVILEYEFAISDPDSGDVEAHVRIRRNALDTSSYLLCKGRSAGNSDNVAAAGNGVYPLDAGASYRRFDYCIEPPGFNQGITIRLIGYWG